MALLSLQKIHKTFEKGTVNENHVLRGLDLDIEQGDFISVIGGNGAGKSTLMNSIAGVLSIDEGDILLEGQSIKKASVDVRSKILAVSSKTLEWGQRPTFLSKKIWLLPTVVVRNVASLKSQSPKVNANFSRKPW